MKPIRARATLRLAVLLALVITAVSLAGMGLQYRQVGARLMATQQAVLKADMDGYAALYDQRRIIALRQAMEFRAAALAGRDSTEMFLLLDKQGQRLAGTLNDWPAMLPAMGHQFTTDATQVFTLDGQRWLGVARILPGGFPLLVARSLAEVDATLVALRRSIAMIGAIMLALGAGVGWAAARAMMLRIDRINTLADRVAAGELDARLPGPRSRDEFGLLERHVHGMLDRIQNLNRATHRLSDTIAHELRTPLNRMLQKLAPLTGQPEVVEDLRAEMRQAIRIFDSLLDISRAEADQGTGGGLVPVDLSAVAAEVWELYEPLAEDKGLHFTATIAPDLRVLGDRNLIAQVLSNLLDNAIKFCRPGDAVHLDLAEGPDRHRMRIEDTGPGVPDDIRDAAFERFVRAERDREVAGHGLGLALVRAITTRHGARLDLPKARKGFAIEIGWPKLQPGTAAATDSP